MEEINIKPLDPPTDLTSSDFFSEILTAAASKNTTISFYEKRDMEESALTSYPEKNKINIIIKSSEIDKRELYIHELLHAKMSLLGFPSFRKFNSIEYPAWIVDSIKSLENTLGHIHIFEEMRKMSVYQTELNEAFASDVIEAIQSETIAELCHAVNFLELSIRDRKVLDGIRGVLREKKTMAFILFEQMEKVINTVKTDSPLNMRETMVQLLRLIDQFIYLDTGINSKLNFFYSICPGFPEHFLDAKASSLLYAVELEQYHDIFILDNIHHQTCFIVNAVAGGKTPKHVVDQVLEEETLGFLINYFG
ncbi:hypothetical protein [Paenibacillus polymyxa]|uniref:Uncharacterized protein n=1 Tax=Paenibacillus polymyxa (strain SC2) TaxID=886882 RepID=E3EKP5_PAEPS|nr:hypothetical protein [Paenibacillus polymyxa]ADO59496.1 hypothetical protein PPSC2_27600 [Paenibacillus polymyxa SC2]WPQ59667.1 hypothetical protein SKN87_28830 [Paenibacillus polymyxa]